MFKSVQTRTMCYLVTLAVGLLVTIGFILSVSVENVGHNMKAESLRERALLISKFVESAQTDILTPESAFALIQKESQLSDSVLKNTFLISKNYETVGYTDPEIPYTLNFKSKNTYEYIYKNGQDYICGISAIENVPQLEGWYVCTEESFSSAFSSLNSLKTGVIVLITVLLFILWPLAKKLSMAITEPIKSLSNAVETIAQGDISHEITTKNKDELADIANSFNTMLNKLKSTMQQVLLKSGEAASMHEIMEYVEQAYDNLSAGIISINNIGEITTYNEMAEFLIGIKSEEVLGLDIKNPIPKELKPLIDALRRCLAKGSLQLKTLTDIYDVNGTRIPILYSINIQFGLKNEVIGAICVFRRIQDIERFQESANRTKNLEALGEMAASLAHEIKNPLTSIRGYAQLIRLELGEQKINLDELEIIMHEADRLSLMLDRFLNFARPKVPKLAEVEIKDTISYVIALVQNELPSNIKIFTNFSEVPKVMIDTELFEPVILNLILNAVQALPNGGNIDIRTGYSEKRKMVYIEIRDNGVGIPRELSEKIFQPFFTTKDNGSGMGLAIASRTIEAHKGILEVESIIGQMTKFTILLQSFDPLASNQ
ncbi:sensor histidine kinase [Aminipila sp.]|uniref:sensor histidine kinase n=1 Tax=Aminipila sp. TaxID=2060095 RepID=UPI00289D6EE5|nr:ATP-binding protein [Aminipila sp.]